MKKISLLILCLSIVCVQAQVSVKLSLPAAADKAYTGKFYLFTQSDTTKHIPNDPDPGQAFFVWTVNSTASEMVLNSAEAGSSYLPKGNLQPGYYKVAGILDMDAKERGRMNPGNWFSPNEFILKVNADGKGEVAVTLNRQIPERKFKEHDLLKEVVFRSDLLTSFRKEAIYLKAAIRLPASYHKDSVLTYPVVFVIPGWGGTHFDLQGPMPVKRYGMDMGKEKIYVYLNPETQSPFGLHAFVDSRVNGPWGKALVEELIPYLQKQYRINTSPTQRFLIGQSTGGYGALWLQLHYPEAFGGCWAVSPDPVDFSAFIGINLYEEQVNLYTDATGKERGTFFFGGKPMLTVAAMAKMEAALGDGEQLQAFEAEFGVPDKQGRPKHLYDAATGKIDPKTVKTWEKYDLAKWIVQHRKQLYGKIDGKVHVYAGADDNFKLNEAVQLFGHKAAANQLQVRAELIPNADHWSIWTPAFTKRIQEEMDAKIKQ
jgi:S-formylglutathione hydrolase FrmB